MKTNLLIALSFILTMSIASCKKSNITAQSNNQNQTQGSDTGSVTFIQQNSQYTCGTNDGSLPSKGNQFENVVLAYSSADLMAGTYFASKSNILFKYSFHGLKEGTYYYKSNTSITMTQPCYPSFVSQTKQAAFTIKAGENLQINIP